MKLIMENWKRYLAEAKFLKDPVLASQLPKNVKRWEKVQPIKMTIDNSTITLKRILMGPLQKGSTRGKDVKWMWQYEVKIEECEIFSGYSPVQLIQTAFKNCKKTEPDEVTIREILTSIIPDWNLTGAQDTGNRLFQKLQKES